MGLSHFERVVWFESTGESCVLQTPLGDDESMRLPVFEVAALLFLLLEP